MACPHCFSCAVELRLAFHATSVGAVVSRQDAPRCDCGAWTSLEDCLCYMEKREQAQQHPGSNSNSNQLREQKTTAPNSLWHAWSALVPPSCGAAWPWLKVVAVGCMCFFVRVAPCGYMWYNSTVQWTRGLPVKKSRTETRNLRRIAQSVLSSALQRCNEIRILERFRLLSDM